jgi:SAM-dependent methyltransferase
MTESVEDMHSPAGILSLGNSFCYAKALLTAVELGLFTELGNSAASPEQIRARLGLHGRGLKDFLDLLVTLGLLERNGRSYRNAIGAMRYLVASSQDYIGGFLEGAARNLYPAWGRLPDALRTGQRQTGMSFNEMIKVPEIRLQFVHMMDALTRLLSPQLIDKFDWSEHETVLDVGGCKGTLVAQLLQANPHLRGHVFDLPELQAYFDESVAELGLATRMTFHSGDFFKQNLPHADVVILGHVLHDWNVEQRSELLANAYAAVNPGGGLLIYDRMLEDEPNHAENLVVSLSMLLVTEGGSEYAVRELRRFAASVGCSNIWASPIGHDDTLVIMRK